MNRREFLGTVGLGAARILLPRQAATHTESFVMAMDNRNAPLTNLFAAQIERGQVTLILYNLSARQPIATIFPDTIMPVASAFKAGVLMYFVHQIEESVWNRVPVQYWDADSMYDMPLIYRDNWQQNRYLLRDLYRMIVLSDNPAVGRTLSYIARQQGSLQPVALFNAWSRNVVGLSLLSGINQWYYGTWANMDNSDPQYAGRRIAVDGQLYAYYNVMTARDLGLYYTWFLDELTSDQQLVAGTLLNVVKDFRRSNIEFLAAANRGMAFSKNGTLGASISAAGDVITDAGIIQHGNGTTYLMVFMSVGAGNSVSRIFELADHVLKGRHDETIQQFAAAT